MRFNGCGFDGHPPSCENVMFVCSTHGFFTFANTYGLVAAR